MLAKSEAFISYKFRRGKRLRKAGGGYVELLVVQKTWWQSDLNLKSTQVEHIYVKAAHM